MSSNGEKTGETSDNESETEYEVEEIVRKRTRKGSTEYLVKWKGYPSSENTWEPEKHLKNAPLLVGKFNVKRCRRGRYAESFSNPSKPIGNAFERGLMPEEILCLIHYESNIQFLIKFLYEDDLEIVSGDLALANCPLLVHDFCKKIEAF